MKMRVMIAKASLITLVFVTGAAWSQQSAPSAPAASAPPPELNGPIVKTKQGKVQGFIANDVAVFRGLPFAAPPVGDLRWRAPKDPEKWSEVRPGNKYGGNCQQVEDCLYLNIYTPAKATPRDKLPVMVWIHGGAFIFGSGATYDGTQFAKQGLVVVTINYRLGRAGWFAHPALTQEKPRHALGNYGLMDQVAALEWVQENIREFGGDRGNVTIFGESAGAISINYLMLAKQAQGLFHKAISESGFGRLPAQPLSDLEKYGVAFTDKAGIKGSDAAAVKAMRALSWEELNKGTGGLGAADQPLPMHDGKLITTASALDGFAKGRQAKVPYLLGGNSDEASLTRRTTNSSARFEAIKDRRDVFLAAFHPDSTGDKDRIIARLVTDESISEPDRALARLHAKRRLPTYIYHFSYTPMALRGSSFGLAHGGEIAYVFNTPRAGGQFDDEGKLIAAAANKYWGQFAKTGDPGSAGGAAWPRFKAGDEALMEFPAGGVPIVHKRFHAERLNWVEQSLRK